MRKRSRVVHVGHGHLKLIREVRHEIDDPAKDRLEVAAERLNLAPSTNPVRDFFDASHKEWLRLWVFVNADARKAMDEDAK